MCDEQTTSIIGSSLSWDSTLRSQIHVLVTVHTTLSCSSCANCKQQTKHSYQNELPVPDPLFLKLMGYTAHRFTSIKHIRGSSLICFIYQITTFKNLAYSISIKMLSSVIRQQSRRLICRKSLEFFAKDITLLSVMPYIRDIFTSCNLKHTKYLELA